MRELNANILFDASEVAIDNLRVDGVAKELYKVDITSDVWNITCNYYDFMYGGEFEAHRKFIFINGVSIFDINANTDDSRYVYSTFPMTGADDATFAHPVLIETHAQNSGDPHKITLWMHKDYINSLDGKIVVTLGAGYSAYTSGKYLAEKVDYALNFKVEINDGTNAYETYIFQGGTVGSLGTPSKDATSTAMYEFIGWYVVNMSIQLPEDTVITAGMRIEARFTETAVNFIETDIDNATYSISEKNNSDRWFYFKLTNHDYPVGVHTYNFGVEYVKSLGIFEKITIKGKILLKSTNTYVEEATLAEIGKANGYGEAVFMNIWNANENLGTVAFRVLGVETITEVIVEEGAIFPSYAYVFGETTTKTYYVLQKTFTALNNNDEGLDGSFYPEIKPEYDIQMAVGAGVRISSGNDYATSGLRFETKISEESVLALQKIAEEYPVTFGTLIVPKDYLVGGLFTHEWLDNSGLSYIDIESTAWLDDADFEFPVYEDGYYSFFLSIVNLKKNNLDREFVGLGYIAIDFDEGRTYIYAPYDPSNARSASCVANAAIIDRNTKVVEGEYDHYIGEDNNYSPYTEAELDFLETYITWSTTSAISAVNLDDLSLKGGKATIEPTTQKLNGPYVELVYTTNVNVWGVFTYTDGNKTASEDFYLQAGTTRHRQYLDIFRKNGVGYGMNTSNLSMSSIEFINAELEGSNAPAGKVRILALNSKNKPINMEKQEIYLTVAQADGSEMTVGAHLGLGGALTYLAKSGIYEGITSVFGSVKIGTSTSGLNGGYYGHATSSKPADGAVNLINNYDAGRQIQQSWYAQVGGSDEGNTGANGYTRAFCKTESSDGKYWPYNPVQAGDVVSNPSQIIDYEINEAKGYIYVKARAMDWAKGQGSDKLANTVAGGVTTKSYVENYYRLNDDGTVVVDNSFVDWNGFTDMETCNWASTELPAVYPVHTLSYYVSNLNGDGSWTDGLEYKSGLGNWTNDKTSIKQSKAKDAQYTNVEEWFAWANGGDGNALGLGMYIPNVFAFTSGRSSVGTSYLTPSNQNSDTNILKKKGLMSNMQPIEYSYQSAYVGNTSYTAPGINFRMEAFVSIEYSYVLCVDTVNNIRSTFKDIKDSGSITNAGNGYEKVGLDAWARSDKQWTW